MQGKSTSRSGPQRAYLELISLQPRSCRVGGLPGSPGTGLLYQVDTFHYYAAGPVSFAGTHLYKRRSPKAKQRPYCKGEDKSCETDDIFTSSNAPNTCTPKRHRLYPTFSQYGALVRELPLRETLGTIGKDSYQWNHPGVARH
jgi:hypothetical protein